MTLLGKVNSFILTYSEGLKSFKRFGLWLPFLVVALLQVIVLFILVSFFSPLLAWILVPVLKGAYGEAVLHYPNFYLFLPAVFNRANIIAGLLLGVVLDGAAALMFCDHFSGNRISFLGGLRAALSKYWRLFVLGLLGLPVILVMRIPFLLLGDVVTESPRRELALEVGCMILGVTYAGIFAYAVPGVIWRGKKTLAAIADSWRIFVGNFFSTFLFISIPLAISFPVNMLKRQGSVLITKFNPEIVIWLAVLGVFVSIFVSFLRSATLMKFYLEQESVE